MQIDLTELLKKFAAHGTTFLVATGVFWTVARPHAEEFVRTEVAQNVDKRFSDIESSIKTLQANQANQTIQNTVNQARTEKDLDHLKERQAEASDDIKDIARGLRSRGFIPPADENKRPP